MKRTIIFLMSITIIPWCSAMNNNVDDLSVARKKQPQQRGQYFSPQKTQPQQLTNARQIKKHVRRNQNNQNNQNNRLGPLVQENTNDTRIKFSTLGKDKQKDESEDEKGDDEKNVLNSGNFAQN